MSIVVHKCLENWSTPWNEVLSGSEGGGVQAREVEGKNEKNGGNMQEAAIGFRDKSICHRAKFSDSLASSASSSTCFTRAFTLPDNVCGEI